MVIYRSSLPWSPALLPFQRNFPGLSTWLRASRWPATWSTQSSRSLTRTMMINSATRSSSASWRTGCSAAAGWESRDHLNAIYLYFIALTVTEEMHPLNPLPPSLASLREQLFIGQTRRKAALAHVKEPTLSVFVSYFLLCNLSGRRPQKDTWLRSQVRFNRMKDKKANIG